MGAEGPLVLKIHPSGTTERGMLDLRVTPAESEDLRESLTAAGFHVSKVVKLSTGEALQTLGTLVAAAGGFGALSAVIVAFLHRHRGKESHLTVAGEPVVLKGYSHKEIEKMAATLREADAEHRRAWRQQPDRWHESGDEPSAARNDLGEDQADPPPAPILQLMVAQELREMIDLFNTSRLSAGRFGSEFDTLAREAEDVLDDVLSVDLSNEQGASSRVIDIYHTSVRPLRARGDKAMKQS